MATTSDIRNGLCIHYNNDIYKIIEFLHVKPGKGPAFVRTKVNVPVFRNEGDKIKVETDKGTYKERVKE
jgi:translation elongation factor P/translation initiation factor 5A